MAHRVFGFPQRLAYPNMEGWAEAVEEWMRIFLDQHTEVDDAIQMPVYAVANVPSAVSAGMMIFVNDEAGGAILAFSDGTNWRRVSDRAIIS